MTATLWPADLGPQRISTPLAVMRKQARALEKLSNGWLNAEVRTAGSGNNAPLQHSFVVLAPYLGDVEFVLFSVRHGLMIYPLTIATNPHNNVAGYECFDEAEFTDALREILAAESTTRIITALVSQSEDSQQSDADDDDDTVSGVSVADSESGSESDA